MSRYIRTGPPPRWSGIYAILVGLAFMGFFLVKAGRPLLQQGYWWFVVLWCLIPCFIIYGGIMTLLGKNKGPQKKENGTVVYKAPGFDVAAVIFGGAFLVIGVYWLIQGIRAGSSGWVGALLWMILPALFLRHGLKNLFHQH